MKNINATVHKTTLFTNKGNFIRDAISEDRPVLIGIHGSSQGFTVKGHEIVGYGYESDGSIMANFGWLPRYYGDSYACINIAGFAIDDAVYIKYEGGHICSNNYKWSFNGCDGTICSCGKKTCNHASSTISTYDATRHQKTCNACGTIQLFAHNFINNGLMYECSDCGYQTNNIHTHKFILYKANSDGYTHTAKCECGYSEKQMCIGVGHLDGEMRCKKCGRLMS